MYRKSEGNHCKCGSWNRVTRNGGPLRRSYIRKIDFGIGSIGFEWTAGMFIENVGVRLAELYI